MKQINVAAKRGTVLNGVLFDAAGADTVVIAITGIHGNFYSNPFYYNFGDTLNTGGIDFIYAQTNDAFGQIVTYNANTNEEELIGSWNERFEYTDEDIEAYLDYSENAGYRHIILAGHSLGANKVMPAYYRSLPGALAHELVAMDKAGASNEELGKKMGGFTNIRIGMLEGDMDVGYVSVGNGISFIHEIKSVAQIIADMTENYK